MSFLSLFSEISLEGWKWGILLAALIIASVLDVKEGKVPNGLFVVMILFGLFLGFLSSSWTGVQQSLLGLGVGFALFFPLWLFRVLAGADVKLLMSLGIFLSPQETWAIGLTSLAMGGFFALLFMISKGRLKRFFHEVLNSVFLLFLKSTNAKDLKNQWSKAGVTSMPFIPVMFISAVLVHYGWI
jgi:Flp pilus assembly protein protease CpaA